MKTRSPSLQGGALGRHCLPSRNRFFPTVKTRFLNGDSVAQVRLYLSIIQAGGKNLTENFNHPFFFTDIMAF